MKGTPRQQAQRSEVTRQSVEQHVARRKLRVAEREFMITAAPDPDLDSEPEPDYEPGSLFDRIK